ncbi:MULTISPECIES: UDP-glucose 4-epimerase GalE [unclassified Corynebacterium]|uniref:UDP-glucose 4-epimerase GalE n=1 Tax=unclassified Corynebacterium TaxID=2624378 RepID=UPI0029C9EFAB|nr:MULTISPECIES: UDP-glucose 4-epimerase GalE [unclassified Corynebacterium]WPF65242.1 UDP-glucose 4-epimerase GalE [Corynebacterium sp. 22KM0430]WPF67737.1 UDP-glucose 4-epimerase GalE [Corynebacterium sp. 21KM1197]
MKLLVTGGAGYVGSVCSQVLIESGHDVTIVDDFSTGNRDAVPHGARLVEGRVDEVVDAVLSEGGFEGVLHFAARSLVGESMEEPDEYWRDNMGTSLNLLEAMRRHQVNNLVFSSTAATYGEPNTVPITEDFPTAPTNTYGATKLAIDYAITSYAQAYGLAATSLRYFNVAGAYGGLGEHREIETHLIPLVLQVALGQRDKILIFGEDWPTADGTAVRDYIHIRDLAQAHVLALESNHPGTHRIYNLGSGAGNSVREVIEACREVTGHPIPAELAPRRAGDPAVLIASSERIMAELGWRPERTDIRTIVSDAWEYTRNRD